MSEPIILASGSKIRADLLRNAGVSIRVEPARVSGLRRATSLGTRELHQRDEGAVDL